MRIRVVYGLVVVSGLFAGAALAAFDGSPDVGAGRGPDVIINELMPNPRRTYDSRGEWIELYNRGDAPADLGGWTIGDEIYESVTMPSIVIEPGGYALLAKNGDAFLNGGVTADWVFGNEIILWNSDDLVVLRDGDGMQRDVVDYRNAGFTVYDGRSMALADPALDNGDGASWCASTTVMDRGDLGSPGAANRCTPTAHPLVITEIMQNPGATSDYTAEWFEVHNPGAEPVDMTGYTVKDDDHDRFAVDAGVVVAAGGYALFGPSADGNGGVALDFVYGSGMRMFNDSDELVIADGDGVQVDRVRWDDGRTFPDPIGASMALTDPNADNSLGNQWCTSTTSWAVGDKGTPGLPTWCVRPGQQPIVITEIMFDPELPASERNSEWFEVANLGEQAVDLSGWTITGGDYLTHTISSLVVAPGESAVLAANGDPSANGGAPADYVYGTGVPLYNASGRVVLKSTTGAVVDRVDWSAARGFPIPHGRSIALGFASGDNALGANWCESVDRFGDGDFGTPGATNSCERPADPPELRISEIMRNPAAVGDSAGEWIEIHNPTTADVDLEGWAIDDGASDLHIVRGSLSVPAGGYAVIGRSTDTSRNGGAGVDYSYGGSFVLGNGADSIALHDAHGRPVDEVGWDDGATWIRPNGASMALLDQGWCESGPQFGAGDRGTPGTVNDCTELPHLAVVVNEVHTDPNAVSDTAGEWIELYNATGAPVDVNGWVLRDDDFDAHTIAAGGALLIQPGGVIVLGRDRSTKVNGGAPVNYSFDSAFPLSNDADEISLLDADLVPVDRVTWTSTRPLPAAPGASASLRDPMTDNADAANWCTSVTTYGTRGERGTPGAANACEVAPPPTTTSTTTTTTTTTPPTTAAPTTAAPTTAASTTSTTTAPTTTTPSPSSSTSSTTTSTTTTTTTTQPPVVTLPVAADGYAILATAPAVCGNGVQLSGSEIDISGNVRSNGNINISGSQIAVHGAISYGGSGHVGHGVIADSVTHSPLPVAAVVPWLLADFLPGGRWSSLPGYTAHLGSWTVSGGGAAPGIHYVAGDVTISGDAPALTGVTIVATGRIQVSGSAKISPARADMPALFSAGGSCWNSGIGLSGSKIEWSGVIAAPNGVVQVSSSKVDGGRIIGGSVQISGSDIELS
jgi:hypothetical protein